MSNISDSVFCAGLACAKDLPEISYVRNKYEDGKPPKMTSRRPSLHEVEVYSFPQTWGSTALGFGGVGGQAMTTAQTTVVVHEHSAAVYFSTRLAYVISKFTEALMKDVAMCNVAECGKQAKYHQS